MACYGSTFTFTYIYIYTYLKLIPVYSQLLTNRSYLWNILLLVFVKFLNPWLQLSDSAFIMAVLDTDRSINICSINFHRPTRRHVQEHGIYKHIHNHLLWTSQLSSSHCVLVSNYCRLHTIYVNVFLQSDKEPNLQHYSAAGQTLWGQL